MPTKPRPLGRPLSVPTVSREPKPRMVTGPAVYVVNPGKDENDETFVLEWGGETYRFPPGETKIRPKGGAKPEDIASHALGVYQLKGLKIRRE